MKEYQNTGGVISHAAMKANMHRGTAARYLKANAGPEELKQEQGPRKYRTRTDPLKDIMPEAARYLEAAPEIEAKGLLSALADVVPVDRFNAPASIISISSSALLTGCSLSPGKQTLPCESSRHRTEFRAFKRSNNFPP